MELTALGVVGSLYETIPLASVRSSQITAQKAIV